MDDKTQQATSYSTRLTPQQRRVIDEAATQSGCSAAKFIRESAVSRAVEVLNAGEDSHSVLRRLAALVSEQLHNPGIREHWRQGPHDEEGTTDADWRWDSLTGYDRGAEKRHNDEMLSHAGFTLDSVMPLRLPDNDLGEIRKALDHAGSEFLKMLLETWDNPRRNDVSFEPKLSKRGLLTDDEDLFYGENDEKRTIPSV